MHILPWMLYALAAMLAVAGIYSLTLGGHFVVIGVLLYLLCWPTAWLAGYLRRDF